MASDTQVIRDLTADVVLATDATRADTYWTRFAGLMFRSPLASGQALTIEPCGSIHMMFMRFSIDAVFYNRDGVVTKVARGLRPWIGMSLGGRGAHGVVELPAGAAALVSAGDQLEFSPAG